MLSWHLKGIKLSVDDLFISYITHMQRCIHGIFTNLVRAKHEFLIIYPSDKVKPSKFLVSYLALRKTPSLRVFLDFPFEIVH